LAARRHLHRRDNRQSALALGSKVQQCTAYNTVHSHWPKSRQVNDRSEKFVVVGAGAIEQKTAGVSLSTSGGTFRRSKFQQ